MKIYHHSLLIFSLIALLSIVTVPANALTFNNHDYMVINGHYTWEEAHQYLPEGYHLATVTSMDEQNFLSYSLLAEYTGEYWLGASQNQGKAPDEGWQWETGEPWDFKYWASGEANDWMGVPEFHLGIWSDYGWHWNDEHGRANIQGFIAESDPIATPVPEPATVFLLGFGLIGLAGVRRKISKRNN